MTMMPSLKPTRNQTMYRRLIGWPPGPGLGQTDIVNTQAGSANAPIAQGTEQVRACFDADVTFLNGGSLSVEDFRLDVDRAGITAC